jgi:hypothetical protein
MPSENVNRGRPQISSPKNFDSRMLVVADGKENNSCRSTTSDAATSDPLVSMRRIPTAGQRDGDVLALAREAARVNPLLALQLAEKLSNAADQSDIVTLAAGQWAASAPEAAAEWADVIVDSNLRRRALTAVIAAWTEKSPSAAAALAISGFAVTPERDTAILGVVQRWAQTAPEAAAAWASELPPGDLRVSAVRSLVETWSGQDALHCGEWVNRLPAGAERDAAVAAGATQLALSFPPVAMRWAESISDGTMRERTLIEIARTWVGRDADAAEPWIQNAAIPAAVKGRLLALRHEISPGGN